MTVLDSLKLHGKLYFTEYDSRTHLTRPLAECRENACKPGTYDRGVWLGPASPAVSRGVIRATFARQLTHGHASWWFDMWGGWFADPDIMRDMAEFVRIAQQDLANPQRQSIAQLAVVVDENAYALTNDNAQQEYYLTDIVAMAVAERVPVVTASARDATGVLGVKSPLQLADLGRSFQRRQAETLMEAGVRRADPARFDQRGELVCGNDVEIDVNCVFEGTVELGDSVRIAANCVIRNARIGAGTRIEPFSHVDSTTMGEVCVVGPYARTRPGTVLGNDVHLGNFVEVKNSIISDHSKANHLAYVGDADIGRKVNIGAGTITCNYDGRQKSQTILEDGVFIGSNTNLVAPVTIGQNSITGAGSTISRNVPPETLAVERAEQKHLKKRK